MLFKFISVTVKNLNPSERSIKPEQISEVKKMIENPFLLVKYFSLFLGGGRIGAKTRVVD